MKSPSAADGSSDDAGAGDGGADGEPLTMAETGWPLIPREVLPAPVPPATRSRRTARAAQPDTGRQLSLFGAGTTEPSTLDLTGLLAGPGRLDRMGGTARVAVTVESGWRVHVLVAELVSRGLVVHWRPLRDPTPEEIRRVPSPPEPGAHPHTGGDGVGPAPAPAPAATPLHPEAPDGFEGPDPADVAADPALDDDGGVIGAGAGAEEEAPSEVPVPGRVVFEVRTAYSSRLNGLARAWPAAADQLFLSGPRLRLWVAAAGRPVDGGYALGLGDHDRATWPAVDAALRRAGLDGAVSDHGLGYVITGRKRLARLAELVGDRPDAAPAESWPGGAAA